MTDTIEVVSNGTTVTELPQSDTSLDLDVGDTSFEVLQQATIEIQAESTPTVLELDATPTSTLDIDIAQVVGIPGPTGPQGPAGPSGGGQYSHIQFSASDTWTINHNLGFRPNIALTDSLERVIYGDIEHIDSNTAVVTLSFPDSGRAHCS